MPTFDKVDLKNLHYGVVLSDFEIDFSSPVRIGNWEIGKATEQEYNEFKGVFYKYFTSSFNSHPSQEFEIHSNKERMSASRYSSSHDYRYTVIKAVENSLLLGSDISECLRLSDSDIRVEIWCIEGRNYPKHGTSRKVAGMGSQCVSYLMKSLYETPKPVNFDDIREIIELREKLDVDKYPLILRALYLFRSHDVTSSHMLKHLGYFGILECLLSHAPEPNDRADSITKQLIRNLTLLHNRMPADKNLLLDSFNGAKPETVVKRLYSYRSAIAHGNSTGKHTDWLFSNRPPSDKDSDMYFTDQLWLEDYLRLMVRRVITQSMREPQLVTDLK